MTSNKVLGVLLTQGSYKNLLETILASAKTKSSKYLCFVNAHMLVESKRSKEFQAVMTNADFKAIDGVSVLKVNRILNKDIESERFAGMDVIHDLINECELNNLKILLYGSTLTVLESMKTKLKTTNPDLIIAGAISPPFRELTSIEMNEMSTRINNMAPHVVLVSLGCPKQEYWMHSMKGEVNALMLGVGNAFQTFAGLEKRAPKWMQRNGLEWLYRFVNEPKRLWKRYLVTNSLFIFYFLVDYAKKVTNQI